jgi:hypothetical protein
MSASGKFYLAQAATCAQAAEKTQLANQREKYLRAQAAWQALADRENGIVAARDLREAEKAALAGEDTLTAPDENPDTPELATIIT